MEALKLAIAKKKTENTIVPEAAFSAAFLRFCLNLFF
jgi:hypothetical protein